ncbi:hypothetical protein BUE64_10150 [Corynebacterium diphtheriae subsp. lausannense]|nr:hypothetical protein BUE64_10150 [Corynebacterium diphtheriae subsp. lausannense]
MHLLKRSTQAQTKNLALWGGSVIILAVCVLGVWPPLRDSGSLGSFTSGMTPEMAQAMGLSGFDTAAGYLKGNLFAVILPLLVGFMGISGVSTLLPEAERNGHLELLLSLPVARWVVMLARLIGVLLLLLTTGILVAGTVGGGSKLLNMGVSAEGVLAVTAGTVMLGVFHATLAYLCACWGASKGATMGVAGGVLVTGYLVQAVVALVPSLRSGAKFSPWQWALGGDPLVSGWQWGGLGLLTVSSIIFVVLGSFLVERRDIANA